MIGGLPLLRCYFMAVVNLADGSTWFKLCFSVLVMLILRLGVAAVFYSLARMSWKLLVFTQEALPWGWVSSLKLAGGASPS